MIYTIDWLETCANNIAPHWNGKDERFVGGDGETYTEEEAQAASELLKHLEEVKSLMGELGMTYES